MGDGGSRGRIDDAIVKIVPPMLLASSNPYDDLWIKILGARVVVVSMGRPCRRRVLIDVGVDGRIAVRLGRVLQVLGDVRCRFSLVGHSICYERGALLARM
jgi:hypothetical protein